MKSAPIIELRNVWKIYKMGKIEVPALKGMNLTIRKGEFVAIMGPSGSGKSTAMNMVGALDIPTKGEVLLDGQNIAHLKESDLAQIRGKKIGFIFQQFNIIHTLTALENVMLPMMFQDISKKDRLEHAKYLLDLVELEEFFSSKQLVYEDLIDIRLLDDARNKWGFLSQVELMQEECLELALALQKDKRFKVENFDNIIDEIADVIIMMQQAKRIFPIIKIRERIKFKMNRLEQRLNK